MASVAKRPDGRWRARYRDESGREHSRHFAKRVDAQRWLDEITAAVVTGTYVDPRAGRETVQQYAERWRETQDHRPGTAALYERVLRLHVYPVLGGRPLRSVRHSHARAFVTSTSGSEAGTEHRPAGPRHHAHVFRRAVADKLIAESPFRRSARRRSSAGPVGPPTYGAEVRRVAMLRCRLGYVRAWSRGGGHRATGGGDAGLDGRPGRLPAPRGAVSIRQLVYVRPAPFPRAA